jgi:transcriptional regulator with XRE-family HTH domain
MTRAHNDDWASDAKRLKLVREAHDLTTADAAKLAGVTVRTWLLWESGKRGPQGSKELIRFCDGLDISLSWLFMNETYEQSLARCGEQMEKLAPGWMEARHREVVARHLARADAASAFRRADH